MPVKKKKSTIKKTATASPKKKTPAKKKSSKSDKQVIGLPAPAKKVYSVYIDKAAFFPLNSASGYVDLGQDGRYAAASDTLSTPIVLPVDAVLVSFSVHYTNTTGNPVLCFFLRNHADRTSASGETEMSFITLALGTLPPDNYLTATVNTFPNAGVIQDRFLHYLEIPGTGNWGNNGKLTIRGVSFRYTF